MHFNWESRLWAPLPSSLYLLEQHHDQACVFVSTTKHTLLLQHTELSVLRLLEQQSCPDSMALLNQLRLQYGIDCEQDYLDQSLQKLVSFGLLEPASN